MTAPYLLNVLARLADGLQKTPLAFRERHVRYLTNKQNSDGGFSGREGESDLYYTGFALRGLAVLDALTPAVSQRAAAFLREQMTRQGDVVDLFSLLYSLFLVQYTSGSDLLAQSPRDWPDRVITTLESFRAGDGGFGKSPGASSGSTYHTFLVGLCHELLGKELAQRDRILEFVRSRRRDDGGYVEIAPMRRSGTNPTAAAIGVLQLLMGDSLDQSEFEPAIGFLATMPSLEGGLRANKTIPLADLLSTFTGCWTLYQLDALDRLNLAQTRAYARSLEDQRGGFKGGLWDSDVDVEYTFYGLGSLALLGY